MDFLSVFGIALGTIVGLLGVVLYGGCLICLAGFMTRAIRTAWTKNEHQSPTLSKGTEKDSTGVADPCD